MSTVQTSSEEMALIIQSVFRPELARHYLDWLYDDCTRNSWFENQFFAIYLRKSQRRPSYDMGGCSKFALEPTLDVANISVKEPYQRRGIFSRVLSYVEATCPYRQIYIENVLDEQIVRYLMDKRGYIWATPFPDSPAGPWCLAKFMW